MSNGEKISPDEIIEVIDNALKAEKQAREDALKGWKPPKAMGTEGKKGVGGLAQESQASSPGSELSIGSGYNPSIVFQVVPDNGFPTIIHAPSNPGEYSFSVGTPRESNSMSDTCLATGQIESRGVVQTTQDFQGYARQLNEEMRIETTPLDWQECETSVIDSSCTDVTRLKRFRNAMADVVNRASAVLARGEALLRGGTNDAQHN